MPYKVIGQIKHGKDGLNYKFKGDGSEVVEDDFFTDEEKKRLIPTYLEKIPENVTAKLSKIKTEKIEQLKDLSLMTVVECKEMLETEYNVCTLLKYLDQERERGQEERVTLTRFIDSKVHELTGH